MRLLLAEDDDALVRHLRPGLERAGYAVDHARDGRDALFLGQTETYDAVVLDLGLPELAGLDVLRRWRQDGLGVPVLILTARDTWSEKVDGLKSGADDYLTKPFHPEELVARLEALIRRSHGQAAPTLAASTFRLDEGHQCVIRADGSTVALTGTAQSRQAPVQNAAHRTRLRPGLRPRQQPHRGLRTPLAREDRTAPHRDPARPGICLQGMSPGSSGASRWNVPSSGRSACW
jgi:DNA-binding response OmpR family regulator